jgi:hypothetical protein
MTPDWIVEHFDVIENILPGYFQQDGFQNKQRLLARNLVARTVWP